MNIMLPIITPDQSRTARRELGVSQADVASALNLNRQYLSEFENGHTSRLTSNQLRKLRTFYEEKIAEAKANGDDIDITFGENPPKEPPPKVELFSAKRISLSVADDVPVQVLGSTLDLVQDNDARLAVLLQQQVAHEDGFMGSGEFTSDTIDAMQEIFALLSLNYVLYRTLGGWPALKLSAGPDNLQTLSDLIFDTYRPQLEAAGLVTPPAQQSEEVQQ